MALTLLNLINSYQTDPDSTYHKLRYHTRRNHDGLLARLAANYGSTSLADIRPRLLLAWHRDWTAGGQKKSIGHSFVGQLRTLFSFGATILEDPDCERMSNALSKMRFANSKSREERVTAEQCIAIRRQAHAYCWHNIALAQAFQFELLLRQKDVIGEWIPESEPGWSDTFGPKGKWHRGLRWEEIDDHFILRHTTSKRGKPLEADLTLAPMVMEELEMYGDHEPTGPIILCDTNGLPYLNTEYRRKWRILADAAGVPRAVFNMDSRAGGITEATDAGADLESVRHAAQHSQLAMTARYSRSTPKKTADVMTTRVASRQGSAA